MGEAGHVPDLRPIHSTAPDACTDVASAPLLHEFDTDCAQLTVSCDDHSEAVTKSLVEAGAEDRASCILQITVPSDVQAGDCMAVVVPGGHQLQLAMPTSMQQGTSLKLLYNPVDSSLEPVV